MGTLLQVADIEGDALVGCKLVELVGREGLGAASSWSVSIATPSPIDGDRALGSAIKVRLLDEADHAGRVIPLVVADLAHDDLEADANAYTLTLVPPEWLLSLRSGYRVFVDKTVQEIVDRVMVDAGIPGDRRLWRLAQAPERRPQCVQYAEDDWSFVERLLADEGIAYWFDAVDGEPRLVLGDDAGSHDGVEGAMVVPFREGGGLVGSRAFFELRIREQMTSGAAHVRDFDVRQPNVAIEARAGEGAFEVFEYPARVLTRAAAERRATVRLEQLQRDARVVTARSDCMRLQPGRLVDIEGCTDDEGNGRYLIVAVEHEFVPPAPGDVVGRAYGNRVTLVPAARTYRPAVYRSAARVSGLETAVTTGPGSEEIHVDDLGRVKLRFPWDRSGIGDDRSSAWVRCLQMAMGGSMLLPRVGWEVPVAFMYGDPDRPVVLGRLYNAAQVVPYTLPVAAATTTLQSATSPGGGGTNEIRMSDVGGAQEMLVHASRDQTVRVGGSSKTTIGGDEAHDVGLSYGVKVGGSHVHTIGGAQSIDVGTAHALIVHGARSESIGAAERIDVGGSRGVTTQAYVELVGGFYGIRCNQANAKVTGAWVELVGASMNLAAGLGTGENVAAARTEIVAGARTVVATKFGESVRGAKRITAGSASDKATSKAVILAKGGGAIEAASARVTAGGPVTVSSPTMRVEVAGTIRAGALVIGGGALKVTKGKTKIKGEIRRKGATEIE